jgi:putative SOS response-associated peptidase YedK
MPLRHASPTATGGLTGLSLVEMSLKARVRELLTKGIERLMCGRFSLTWEEWQNVAGKLGLDAAGEIAACYMGQHNIAPTDTHFIVTTEYERRRAQVARWGLVNRWARDNRQASKCINARAETIDQRTIFREAYHKRRCVVPADGFYEWTGPKNDRRPLWIHPRAGELMLFAGLYESWYPAPGQSECTLTIVTCAGNEMMREIHDRMRVVLDEAGAEDWMNPREENPLSLKRLLVPAAADLRTAEPAAQLSSKEKNRPSCCFSRSEAFSRKPDVCSNTIFRRAHALGMRVA